MWLLRVLVAYTRRELQMAAQARLAFVMRGLSFAGAVVALYFFSRFVGAAHNQHLDPYGGDYLAFGMVGFLAAQLQQVGVTGLAHRIRMAQLMGHLEAELATPAPAWMVLAAGPLYELGSAAVRSVVYLLGATLLLGARFGHANLATLAVVLPLVLVAFVGLGLLSAATTLLVRRANPVALLLGTASLFLSGVVYPVSVLPGWLRGAADLLPLTHALEALRRPLLTGAPLADLVRPLVALLLFAVVLTPAGLLLFRYALRRARTEGSLTRD